ncbi:DUF6089 family protein [Crocinitomix catalasitica]|uniref:DUF6089 family protein n=1 Tax=Crocinitomix catalasitica TaxID=184607 RepID=UPI0004841C88|nr:DUF6089 family protein [Crocinitomix catalasitica]
MKKSLLFFLILISVSSVNAQAWRYVRNEVFFGVGATNFLGDLGGSQGIGTHGIKDLKFSMTRPTMMLGYKYALSPYFSAKVTGIYGLIHGDDAVTKNIVRNTRNLSFRSVIGEFSAILEYYPMQERIKPRYKIKGVKGNKAFSLMPFFYAGVGVTFFNPKAEYDGTWYALQPLATEGQGMAGREDKYKRYTLAIPMGVGLKYVIDKQWSVSFELSLRYTMSDYLDDVSTSYYLNDEIVAANGDVAGALADRAVNTDLGLTGIHPLPDGRNNYLQRGDPTYNDAYMFGLFSVHYRFKQKELFIPKF